MSMGAVLRKIRVRSSLRRAYRCVAPDTSVRSTSPEKPHVFVGLAADYGNLGDLAITQAQCKFLERRFPEAVVEALPISRSLSALKQLRKVVQPNDLLTLIGGGNTGDMYDDIQCLRELFIKELPRVPIVSFPQTIEFSDSRYGRWSAQRASKTYEAHSRLSILARDSASQARAEKLFPTSTVVLAPDVVLTLNEHSDHPRKNRVLVALRSDLERGLSEADAATILATAAAHGLVVERDTHVGSVRLSAKDADAALSAFWADCGNSRLMMTDRLHGMIFAVITGTPCVVFDSGTGKVSQFHRNWLGNHPQVILLTDNDFCQLSTEAARMSKMNGAVAPPLLAKQFEKAFEKAYRAAVE